jgi:exodeoxyribonuclease VII large subunit
LEPKGLGSLQLALEQLKARLEKEGLFAEAHKRPIPYLPKRLGLVTSLQGAAIKDILKVLDRRFRDVQVIISPARVQGEGAGAEVARAIAELNKFNAGLSPGERIEVMIVGRGGGSIEDLWAFNEEIVARAIYASEIPVVSAVGHERDWTIADLVADLRAATPSVAAELVLPQKEELKDRLGVSLRRMKDVFSGQLIESRQAVDDYAGRLLLASRHILELSGSYHNVLYKKLLLLNPEAIISRHKEKMLELARQVTTGTQHLLQLSQARLNKAAERLSGLSPLNILARGYSISFRIDDGAVIKEIKYLKPGDLVRTKLRDGDFISQVKEVI